MYVPHISNRVTSMVDKDKTMIDLVKSAHELISHLDTLNKVAATINLIGMPDALKEVVKLPDVKCVVYKRPLTDNLIKIVFNDGSCFVMKDVN
ncbi:hypothetical protein KEN19_CDS0202 [Pseudomonas phage vB_PaePAO1-KEN19]